MATAIAQVAMPELNRHDNSECFYFEGTYRPLGQQKRVDERRKAVQRYDDVLAELGAIEASAGPTLLRSLGRSKRVQAAFVTGADRATLKRHRFGQRAALLRVMRHELGDDPVAADEARHFLKYILMASANVAVITGSGWPSVRSWLAKRLPTIMATIATEIEAAFTKYVTAARDELALRIPSGDPSLYTGATPGEIAEALELTAAQLQAAKANRVGLPSIDNRDAKTRDRQRKEAARRKAGMKSQGERTVVAEMKALAEQLGCSLSTIQRKRRDGTLEVFVAGRMMADQKVSATKISTSGGQILVKAPSADNDNPSPIAIAA